jgi:drug/metabolite transporter (DMT)-like permease
MTWQILIALCIFLTAVATLLQKVIMKDEKVDPIASAIFLQIIMTVITFGFLVFSNNVNFSGIEKILPNLFIMMVLIGSFYFLLFKSLKLVDASLFAVINSSRAVFTIFASTTILSENLSPKQILGVIAVLSAIALVLLNKNQLKFGKGEFYCFLAAVSLGFATTNDRIALLVFPVIPYIFLSTILPTIFLIGTNPTSFRKMKILTNRRIFPKFLLMSVIQLSTLALFLKALQIGNNSSQITIVNESYIIVTVLLGIIFLKETSNLKRKVIGSIIAFIGIILIG